MLEDMTPVAYAFPDFNRAPFLVIWEVTRACALACVHCRADAIHRRDPRELTTDEGFRLIDQVRGFGEKPPLFVLTGGDPMRRPDLAELVRYAAGTGLTVALTPSGTAAATPAKLAALKEAGLSRVAVSLDGPTPELHDAFRGVRGSYAWTMRIIEAAIDLELPLQINSTISRRTLEHFEAMAARVAEFPLTLWALFFLIQTGRGASLEQINDVECEKLLNRLYDLSLTSPFGIKTTEAPHYQRVVWQREQERMRDGLPSQAVARRRQLRAPRSVNDGNGFVFIDHLGNICPSGFLPVQRGNVQNDEPGGGVPQRRGVLAAPKRRRAHGQVRPLRVPGDLRRIPVARVRGDRRGDGLGSAVRVRAWPGRRASGCADASRPGGCDSGR